jgi:anti-anti-sigma factor
MTAVTGAEYRVSVVRADGELAVVELSGEVDMANVQSARRQLVNAVPEDSRGIVLDLSGLIYLDSAGVRMLFDVSEQLEERGARVAASIPPDASVRKILAITRLDTLIPVRDSVHEAAEAAGSGVTP